MKGLLFLIVVVLVGGVVFYGCNGVDKSTQNQVSKTASNALDTTKKAVVKFGSEVQKSAVQTEETMKVKGPIDDAKDIDSSNIAIDTMGKTIVISGTVPSDTQKQEVEKLAKTNADPGYKIEDNLKIAASKDSTDSKDSNTQITDDQGH